MRGILKLRSLVQLIMPLTKALFFCYRGIHPPVPSSYYRWFESPLNLFFGHWLIVCLFVCFLQEIQFVIYFEAVHFFVFHQTNCLFDFYPSCHFNLVNINASQVDMDTDKIGSVLFCYSSFWRLIFDKKECHPIYDLIGI